MTLAIDRDLKGDYDICFHPNSNAATVKLNYNDFLKFLRHLGREPLYIEA